MSNFSLDFSADEDFRPLAARMRPATVDQYCGQQHILGSNKPLRRALEAGHIHSMILWGPPGTGKTTLAEVAANYANAEVERISAVTSGVKDIRLAIEKAREHKLSGRKTILFVDEVHRFNKSQQDAFLPHIEDGTVTFIGATTENPSFELNNALAFTTFRLPAHQVEPPTRGFSKMNDQFSKLIKSAACDVCPLAKCQ